MMDKSRNYTIDIFRIIAIIFIVALHTSPFLDINRILSYLLCQVFSRLGVPFFAAISGYYFFKNNNSDKYKKMVTKYIKLYLVWTAIYFMYHLLFGGSVDIVAFFEYIFFGFYHLWYLLAIVYTLVIVYIFEKLKKVNLLYCISFVGLLIGVLLYGYGNVSNFSIYFNINSNMPYEWLFSVIPFFMMGYGLNRYSDKYPKSYVLLLIMCIFGYILDIFLLQVFNIMLNSTLCLFTYPIVYLLMVVAIKKPNLTNKISKYCSGISGFIYFSHILFVFLFSNIFISETLVFVCTLLTSGMLGFLIVKFNTPYLRKLI